MLILVAVNSLTHRTTLVSLQDADGGAAGAAKLTGRHRGEEEGLGPYVTGLSFDKDRDGAGRAAHSRTVDANL